MNSTPEKAFSDKKFFQHILKTNAAQIEKSAELIKLFGGQIEQFLDNEVNYVLTDIPKSEWPPKGRDRMLENASRLGVKLMSLNDLRRWCSKYVSSQSSSDEDDEIKGLKRPFIKIEDSEGRCAPIVKEFEQWPELTFNEHVVKSPINNKSPNNNNRRRKRRSIHCELCGIHFSESIEDHIETEQHKLKTENTEYWADVHKVLESIPSISTLNTRRLTNLTPPSGIEHQEFICLHKLDSVSQLFN